MVEFTFAEANQLLAAAEKRLMRLRSFQPSEERQLAIEATRSSIAKLRVALGISPEGLCHGRPPEQADPITWAKARADWSEAEKRAAWGER